MYSLGTMYSWHLRVSTDGKQSALIISLLHVPACATTGAVEQQLGRMDRVRSSVRTTKLATIGPLDGGHFKHSAPHTVAIL